MSESTQALVKRAPVEGVIVEAQEFNRKVAEWRAQGYAVLTPVMALSTIPKHHYVEATPVTLDPNPVNKEVYFNSMFCKQGEVAPSKEGLLKIAQAAGISIDESVRCDSRTVEHVWSYRVRGHWIAFNGTRIDRIKNKTIDLRDGSPDIKGFTPNQIEQARRHGEAVCESKAQNRLIRDYGIKQKYTQQELVEHPFMVLQLKWDPPMDIPVVAALVTQIKMGMFLPNAAMPGLPAPIDPATQPLHLLPPELRPSTTPAEDVRDDDDDDVDDIPVGEPRATATPRARAPLFTITLVRREANLDGWYITTKETGEEQLHIGEKALAQKAKGAWDVALPVRLTFDPASTPGNRCVTAVRLGNED